MPYIMASLHEHIVNGWKLFSIGFIMVYLFKTYPKYFPYLCHMTPIDNAFVGLGNAMSNKNGRYSAAKGKASEVPGFSVKGAGSACAFLSTTGRGEGRRRYSKP